MTSSAFRAGVLVKKAWKKQLYFRPPILNRPMQFIENVLPKYESINKYNINCTYKQKNTESNWDHTYEKYF